MTGHQRAEYMLFDHNTRAVVYGLQSPAVQRMLDFDYMCKRETPSVAAMVDPTSNNGVQKFYWGTSEILLPIYSSISQAVEHFPEVDVMINFAPVRSAYSATIEALNYAQIRTIAIIAEGVPERRTRMLIHAAAIKGVTLIGPATLGAIKPGCFRIGSAGGTLDHIMATRLYRPGSVAFVSRSGGLLNELNNIIARHSDGVYEGIAIGGDMFPGTTFLDHLLRFQADPDVKLMVMLGEVGGDNEYAVCAALEDGRITKPLIAWCIGTSATVFAAEVQFGHAGALARGEHETATAKNEALRNAGALVPQHFGEFGLLISRTYRHMVTSGEIVERPEPELPRIPMDYAWVQKMSQVRKPANFISTITDDRGDELLYAGMPMSQIFESDMGIGGVISLLWFKRLLPQYACDFFEMVLIATSDRNPTIAGTTNPTITTAAGKDLVSTLVSGLLTIGPCFGGVIEESARVFAEASDAGLTPEAFVTAMEQRDARIPGIGCPTQAVRYSQRRVAILRDYAHENFAATDLLDYALAVEKIIQRKHPGLVMNVDGCVSVTLLDLLRSCGAFTTAEADEHVQMGLLTGLFLLGRSIDFMGRFIDLQRLMNVAFVSHAPLLSPDMRAMIARNSDGMHTGLTRSWAGATDETLLEQVLRYQADPKIKLMVLVGKPDAREKQALIQALQQHHITRPLVVCAGTPGDQVSAAPGRAEVLQDTDAPVPERLAEFGAVMCRTYHRLALEGVLSTRPAQKIEDVDIEDILYAGMPVEAIFAQNLGIGGVLGLIWFKRQLPAYARRFIEMVLMAIADHGPAVPGAHNTIVAARADKDLVSALASGLLTIGPRFGGAIDDAARGFARAYDAGLAPETFVAEMKQRGDLIIGIGHRVRSLQSPDLRVAILKAFARQHFPATGLLDYALAVEQITSSRRSNLILNIDGCIAVCFVDMLRSCGAFLPEEADMYVQMGFLNGMFMLGRSIGLIGHYLDQKRLRQGLYHHPWDDIAYMLPEDVPTFE